MTFGQIAPLNFNALLAQSAEIKEVADATVKLTEGRSDALVIGIVILIVVVAMVCVDWKKEATRVTREDKNREADRSAYEKVNTSIQDLTVTIRAMQSTLDVIEKANELQEQLINKIAAFEQRLDKRQLSHQTACMAALRYFEARDGGRGEAAAEALRNAFQSLDMVGRL